MTFDSQPNLKGSRLALRPLAREDYPALFAVASDPLLWEQHPANDRYKTEVFAGFFEDAISSGGALVAINSENNRVIGSSRYHDYSEKHRSVEIGWTFLARAYWGGAYNGEIKQLMLGHAFQFVDRVFFVVGATNYRSQKAVEKIGGIHVGTRSDETVGMSNVFEITEASYLSDPA